MKDKLQYNSAYTD